MKYKPRPLTSALLSTILTASACAPTISQSPAPETLEEKAAPIIPQENFLVFGDLFRAARQEGKTTVKADSNIASLARDLLIKNGILDLGNESVFLTPFTVQSDGQSYRSLCIYIGDQAYLLADDGDFILITTYEKSVFDEDGNANYPNPKVSQETQGRIY